MHAARFWSAQSRTATKRPIWSALEGSGAAGISVEPADSPAFCWSAVAAVNNSWDRRPGRFRTPARSHQVWRHSCDPDGARWREFIHRDDAVGKLQESREISARHDTSVNAETWRFVLQSWCCAALSKYRVSEEKVWFVRVGLYLLSSVTLKLSGHKQILPLTYNVLVACHVLKRAEQLLWRWCSHYFSVDNYNANISLTALVDSKV